MTEISIAAKLTELRKAKGATQEEIAEALQISNKTISKWENGTSAPDLEMLVALSRYYNVSTDTLLGLKTEENSTKAVLGNLFKNLDKRQTILKIFEIVKEIYPATFNTICREADNNYDDFPPIPPQNARNSQYRIAQESFFNFAVCSKDVNFAVMQWQNNSNFAWLLDTASQNRIIDILSFLADADVLKVMYFIHSKACSETFTVNYITNNTGVDTKKVESILEKCCKLALAKKIDAHLKNKDICIYGSYGDGLILSILSIAYQKMTFNNNYEYNCSRNVKIIRGEN